MESFLNIRYIKTEQKISKKLSSFQDSNKWETYKQNILQYYPLSCESTNAKKNLLKRPSLDFPKTRSHSNAQKHHTLIDNSALCSSGSLSPRSHAFIFPEIRTETRSVYSLYSWWEHLLPLANIYTTLSTYSGLGNLNKINITAMIVGEEQRSTYYVHYYTSRRCTRNEICKGPILFA